tara:strand:- start:145 stop:585 length:441 start_codon:yes stop_codon:yes gene_type:complete
MVKKEDIINFVSSWKNGILNIGNIYKKGGDYKKEADLFLKRHYLFDSEDVLFKPTLTSEIIFRNSFESAKSYFVKGEIDEDKGFAIQNWQSIELLELNTIIEENLTIAMGKICFKSDQVTNVAFTFVLKNIDNEFKIKVHHSSLIQ